jgi:hypothetical protein
MFPKRGEDEEIRRCSFCAKTQDQVEALISNQSDLSSRVSICNECVAVCNWVLQDHYKTKGATTEDRLKASILLSCTPPKADTLIDRLKAFAARR